jgi:hypothetical protein
LKRLNGGATPVCFNPASRRTPDSMKTNAEARSTSPANVCSPAPNQQDRRKDDKTGDYTSKHFRSTHARANSNPRASASFIVLNIFPSIRATSMTEPARAGLKTEPRNSHPSMYIRVEVPEILKLCIRAWRVASPAESILRVKSRSRILLHWLSIHIEHRATLSF